MHNARSLGLLRPGHGQGRDPRGRAFGRDEPQAFGSAEIDDGREHDRAMRVGARRLQRWPGDERDACQSDGNRWPGVVSTSPLEKAPEREAGRRARRVGHDVEHRSGAAAHRLDELDQNAEHQGCDESSDVGRATGSRLGRPHQQQQDTRRQQRPDRVPHRAAPGAKGRDPAPRRTAARTVRPPLRSPAGLVQSSSGLQSARRCSPSLAGARPGFSRW